MLEVLAAKEGARRAPRAARKANSRPVDVPIYQQVRLGQTCLDVLSALPLLEGAHFRSIKFKRPLPFVTLANVKNHTEATALALTFISAITLRLSS
jgi:hypothetical protein